VKNRTMYYVEIWEPKKESWELLRWFHNGEKARTYMSDTWNAYYRSVALRLGSQKTGKRFGDTPKNRKTVFSYPIETPK